MDYPTPIAEEPSTPLRTEGMATQLESVRPSARGQYSSRPLHSAQGQSAQTTPDYFNFRNPFDSTENLTVPMSDQPPSEHEECHEECHECQHQKKPPRPYSAYIDLGSAIFILVVVSFLFWTFIVQVMKS